MFDFRSEESESEKDEAVDVQQAVSAMAHASNLEVSLTLLEYSTYLQTVHLRLMIFLPKTEGYCCRVVCLFVTLVCLKSYFCSVWLDLMEILFNFI